MEKFNDKGLSDTSETDTCRQSGSVISVCNLVKNFGKHEVLKDINFDVYRGDVTSVIGSSGSGKSTLLRCINVLETPTAGHIYFHGDDILDRNNNITKYRAKVGMV